MLPTGYFSSILSPLQVQGTEDLLDHIVATNPVMLLLATVVCKQETAPVATCLNNCSRVAGPMTTRCPTPP